MAENSKIEWTTHTFNPWIGCQKVGLGCDNCYAEAMMADRYGRVEWGPHGARSRTSAAYWRKPLAWNRAAEGASGRPRVFCASLADVFDNHASVMPEWRADLWALISATPNLDWLLLTKRPGNIGNMLPVPFDFDRHYPNVWLGCTIVNREEMLRDAPKLADIPARVRFWSVEPLLGGLGEIPRHLMPDLVIVGGESGPHARPMHPDWARSLRDQCNAAGVPFFFKQWGQWSEGSGFKRVAKIVLNDGRVFNSTVDVIDPDDRSNWGTLAPSFMCSVGKSKAGRLLDGREWNEMPGVRKGEIEMPVRVQLKRQRGWKMPPNTVKVDRRTIWGNPWGVGAGRGYSVPMSISPWWLHLDLYLDAAPLTAEVAVDTFRRMLSGAQIAPDLLPVEFTSGGHTRVLRDLAIRREQLLSLLPKLRGKNLACWCKPGDPCHASVLLELANGPQTSEVSHD